MKQYMRRLASARTNRIIPQDAARPRPFLAERQRSIHATSAGCSRAFDGSSHKCNRNHFATIGSKLNCVEMFDGRKKSSYFVNETQAKWSSQLRFFSSTDEPKDGDKESVPSDSPPPPQFSDEWIPPNRPLSGDKGNTFLYPREEPEPPVSEKTDDDYAEEFRLLELEIENEEKRNREEAKEEIIAQLEEGELSPEEIPDWLVTRRTALGDAPEEVVPVVHHELLTEDEVFRLLRSLGAEDVVFYPEPDPERPRLGGDGMLGLIIATVPSLHALRSASRELIDHLKKRRLQDLDVIAAQSGAEEDPSWHALDCGNYGVHLFDAETREAVGLDALWSGQGGNNFSKLDFANDEAMDEYVARNPVSPAYERLVSFRSEYEIDAAAIAAQLTRNRFSRAPNQRRKRPGGRKSRKSSRQFK